MSEESLSDLKVAFAKLEGAVTSDLKHLSHDVKNLTMTVAGYTPRAETEQLRKDMVDRVRKLEDNQTWAVRSIIGQWLAGMGVVGTFAAILLKKFG